MEGIFEFDIPSSPCYPPQRPDGSGAAGAFEPRQVRKEAAIRSVFRAPPASLFGFCFSFFFFFFLPT